MERVVELYIYILSGQHKRARPRSSSHPVITIPTSHSQHLILASHSHATFSCHTPNISWLPTSRQHFEKKLFFKEPSEHFTLYFIAHGNSLSPLVKSGVFLVYQISPFPETRGDGEDILVFVSIRINGSCLGRDGGRR